MFQIELGSHKCSYLMKSKNASLHFGEGRGCCPLQSCTLMIIKKIAVAIFFFFFFLIKVSKQCMVNASSVVSAEGFYSFRLVSPNYFHNRLMLKV